MASGYTQLTILEHGRVGPPPATVGNKSIPLSPFDLGWHAFPPIHQLSFYHFPHTTTHFIQTLIPNLKQSLSLTLQHFFPLAGNLIVFPSTTRKPEIRYVEGDSVSLIAAESTNDYEYLIGSHPREADMFHPLVPLLDDVTKNSDGCLVAPLLAVKVTLFPNKGICIGITTNHVACDGNARVSFIRSWASITRTGDDKMFLASGSLPFHDRSIIKDPYDLEQAFWNGVNEIKIQESPLKALTSPTNKVRASFILSKGNIVKLKEFMLSKRPNLRYISSLTIVCALVWSCMAKLRSSTEEDKGEDVLEQFHCVGDARARLDPPIPTTYFGNVLGPCFTTTKRKQLLGDEGFLNAVELIGEAIKKMISDKESIYFGIKMWYEGKVPMPPTMLGVTGSPKFNIYDMDFGFGKPQRCEFVSLDFTGSMSLSTSRDSQEDLEIGLSLSKTCFETFVRIFNDVLLE